MSILTLLALSAPAFAAAPASCMGKTGTELQECNEQRAHEQTAKIAATQRAIEALKERCNQACDNSTPAPRSPVRTGPSRIRQDVTTLQTRIAALEEITKGGVISDEEFRIELDRIQGDFDAINETLDDYEHRIKELEEDESTVTATPIPIAGPPGPRGPIGQQGPAGAKGEDGKDGRPAEIATLVGVDGVHSKEVDIIGIEVGLRIGGRPTNGLRFGGYASGFVAPGDESFGDDLGFGVGGDLGYEVARWFRPSLTLGWREIGLDVTTSGSRRSFHGLEATLNLEFSPAGKWVIDVDGGAFLTKKTAFTWGASTGFRF